MAAKTTSLLLFPAQKMHHFWFLDDLELRNLCPMFLDQKIFLSPSDLKWLPPEQNYSVFMYLNCNIIIEKTLFFRNVKMN